MEIDSLLNRILSIEHGFQHIIEGANEIISTYSRERCAELAGELSGHEAYQIRMLATTIWGRLATEDDDALCFLKERISTDEHWRVQEMLAKAFDEVCKYRGYEASLPLIKENPSIAIALISQHKAHESEYLRKSVGNALKDISKKHRELIQTEVQQWDLSHPRILFTYKLATKLLK